MTSPKKVYTTILEPTTRKDFRDKFNTPSDVKGGKIRIAPTNDYLKYYRPIRKYYCLKYKLAAADFDMIFFLYSEKYFTSDDFDEFNNILYWDKNRFFDLIKNGWINAFTMHRSDLKKVYELSYKGKLFCNTFYQILNGKELPVGHASNPLMGKGGVKKTGLRFHEKVLRLFIIDINKAYRLKKQTGIEDLPYD